LNSTETKTENTNPCQREISVEIPAEIVTKEEASVIAEYQKHARVPGFRRGKVPATVVRQRFKDEVKKDVIEALIPRYFREEAAKEKLAPISQPQISKLDFNEGEPIKFTAVFEVLPEFEVTGYKDIKVEIEKPAVDEKEVEDTLARLQEQNSTYVNVEEERPLADGDFAQVSFKSTGLEEGAEPVQMDEVLVDIGGTNTVKEFTENLRGAKAGEERSFDVTYGEDFNDKRLAGKTLHYTVTVKGIKKKQKPELNDDFAKELGQDFSTLEELRTRIRESMLHEKQHEAEHKGKDKIVDELISRYEFPVPNALVEHQIDQRLERGLRALAQQGLRAEDMKRMDLSRLRDGQREGAVREVKAQLLLEKIAEAENVQISEEDLDKEVQGLARQMQQTPEAIRARLEQNDGLERIRERMRQDKTLDALYKQSM
jgi:trigger factor